MTDYFRVGDSISGDSLFYAFRDRPTIAVSGRRHSGKPHGNGQVRVDEPLRRTPPGSPPNSGDRIVCKTAEYECDKVKERAGRRRVSGSHRGATGYLKGDAGATIRIPIQSRS